MPGLRRPRYLTCFYCGGRTSNLNNGTIRQFECPRCNATNYLDENGDITDPPVATTNAAPNDTQYAKPHSPPRGISYKPPSAGIFCQTCLKNQHLFTASLAQYLPDDPNHPEYARLERGYYKFRKGLEQRYPQVCAECEPKMISRMEKANQTAKSDYIRRKLDETRENRTAQPTALNRIAAAGRRGWQFGFLLQLLWQLSVVRALFSRPEVFGEMDGFRNLLVMSERVWRYIPGPDLLAKSSILISIGTCWWNPRFVQTMRGFTRHVVGLSNWYAYQGITIVIRTIFFRAADGLSSSPSQSTSAIAAHLLMALFTIYIYKVSPRSVRTDTASLWGPGPEATLSPRGDKAPKPDDTKSMADLLDEILVPSPQSQLQQQTSERELTGDGWSALGHSTAISSQTTPYMSRSRPATSNPFSTPTQNPPMSLGSLYLSENPRPIRQDLVNQSEEMDWSPTYSPHRAFNTYDPNQSQARGFSSTPVEPDRGQFWFKVPPAPTSLAQRVLNPPNAPGLRKSPVTKDSISFRGADSGMGNSGGAKAFADARGSSGVDFAPSSLGVPPPKNDPRNSLSELFGQAFSLDSGQETDDNYVSSHGARRLSETRRGRASPPRSVRWMDIAVLGACLAAWVHATYTNHEYSTHVTFGVLCVCIIISARVAGNSVLELKGEKRLSWPSAIGTVLSIGELGLACQLAFALWENDGKCEVCVDRGSWLIGTMLLHQLWNILV